MTDPTEDPTFSDEHATAEMFVRDHLTRERVVTQLAAALRIDAADRKHDISFDTATAMVKYLISAFVTEDPTHPTGYRLRPANTAPMQFYQLVGLANSSSVNNGELPSEVIPSMLYARMILQSFLARETIGEIADDRSRGHFDRLLTYRKEHGYPGTMPRFSDSIAGAAAEVLRNRDFAPRPAIPGNPLIERYESEPMLNYSPTPLPNAGETTQWWDKLSTIPDGYMENPVFNPEYGGERTIANQGYILKPEYRTKLDDTRQPDEE